MNVRFYFDPLCPWCWITSHWLHQEVAPNRGLQIDWRPISLKVRNADKELDEAYERFLPAMDRSFNLLRIVEALRADGREHVIHDVYVAFGRHFHAPEKDDRDGMEFDVTTALREAGLDDADATRFAAAYDDASFDAAVIAATKEAEAVAGNDVGTPVIAYEVDGEWKGYFGPVIPKVIRGEAALRLWDGLAALIETDGFFELKRTRDVNLDLSSV